MVNGQSGFTLIELTIYMLIVSLLAVSAVPLTVTWIDEAAVNDARSQLTRAFSEARSLALRNPVNPPAQGNAVAAGFKLADEMLLVCSGEPTAVGCAAGGTGVDWQANWPARVTLDITEFRLNNRGQLLAAGSPVNTGLSFILNRGKVTYDNAVH